MKIALNLFYLIPGKVGGSETVVRQIIKNLLYLDKENEYLIVLNKESFGSFPELAGKAKILNSGVSSLNKYTRTFYENILLPLLMLIKGYKISFSFGTLHPFVTLTTYNFLYIYDLIYKKRPENFPDYQIRIIDLFLKRAIPRADRIFTLSEYSKKDLIETYQVAKEKIIVTYCAVEDSFYQKADRSKSIEIKDKFNLKKPYFLTVANYYPHKNLKFLSDAFLKEFKDDYNLVIIGIKTKNTDIIPEDSESIIFPGRLSQEDLIAFYQNAHLFVYPSLYEGFGIPVIEAMAAGVPVISSDRTSLKEVGGDGALFFNPEDEQDLINKIKVVLNDEDLRRDMIARAKKHIEKFSWEESARIIINQINSLK